MEQSDDILVRILGRKSEPFQTWVAQNAKECVDHLENVYEGFVRKLAASTGDDTLENTKAMEQNFKAWIETALSVHSSQQIREENEAKSEQMRNELSKVYHCEIENLKQELTFLRNQKKDDELTSQLILNDIQKENARKELHYVNIASQLQLDIEKAKREGTDQVQKLQDQYQNEISVFLKQYTTASSAIKGNTAQIAYSQLLSETFPTAEIEETNATPRSCDIRLVFEAIKQPILVEIKNYSTTVPSLEVDKFKRDVFEKGCHGIMIAQSTGIATKVDQQIEIANGTIQIYLCNNKLNANAVKVAVESIRTLSVHLRTEQQSEKGQSGIFGSPNGGESRTLSSEIIYKIVEELNNIAHVNTRIKESLKATINFIKVEHVANIQRLLEGENITLTIEQPKKKPAIAKKRKV